MRIGYKLLKHIKTSNEKFWFVAETCMAIGMMGTVLGFILMLGGSNLASIDPTDVEGMKNVIGQLASGMSTALLTTLTGLIVSVSLRTQLMIGEGE
jgi:flagellar motor component MotA